MCVCVDEYVETNIVYSRVRAFIKTFRLHLAQELIGEYCSRRRLGRTPSVVRPIPLRHFPLKLANDSELAKYKRGRCARCTTTLHRRTNTRGFVGSVQFGCAMGVTRQVTAFCCGTYRGKRHNIYLLFNTMCVYILNVYCTTIIAGKLQCYGHSRLKHCPKISQA